MTAGYIVTAKGPPRPTDGLRGETDIWYHPDLAKDEDFDLGEYIRDTALGQLNHLYCELDPPRTLTVDEIDFSPPTWVSRWPR